MAIEISHNYKIAVLLTCHNRKAKTISCLKSLFESYRQYLSETDKSLLMKVFLVDDGSTDGTSDEIKNSFIDQTCDIQIIQGNGNLFWARGMVLAWKTAMNTKEEWDFFLLVNDDTFIYKGCFHELFETHKYSIVNFGEYGLYSGITCKIGHPDSITYGGAVWTNKFMVKCRQLKPSSNPQMCDVANANILLVPIEVVNKIGILNDAYQHGFADYEYSMKARKENIPVLVTSTICGECDFDHDYDVKKFCSMSLEERKSYFNSPLHSNKDYLYYIRHNFPIRYPFVLVGRFLNLYFPQLYYFTRLLRS